MFQALSIRSVVGLIGLHQIQSTEGVDLGPSVHGALLTVLSSQGMKAYGLRPTIIVWLP